MRKASSALVIASAAMLAHGAALAVDPAFTEANTDRLNLSREQRPFPRGPIIVNAKKPPTKERAVASNKTSRSGVLNCPSATIKTEPGKSCMAVPPREAQAKEAQAPAS